MEESGLTIYRKMTLDFAEKNDQDNSISTIKRKPTLDEISDASRS